MWTVGTIGIIEALETEGWMVSRLICMGFLLGLSIVDIHFRKVPGQILSMGSVLAAVYCIAVREVAVILCLAGLGIGIGFLLISRISGEALGYGDSWIICILGLYLGIWKLLEVLAVTWVILAAAAGICLIFKRWKRKTALPMIPFLAAGYIAVCVSEQLA